MGTIWIMFILSTFLGWAVLRGGSVWPVVIGHGAFNGIAGIYLFFTQGRRAPCWVHPSVAGLIGSWALALVALVIFLKPGALEPGPAAASLPTREQEPLSYPPQL